MFVNTRDIAAHYTALYDTALYCTQLAPSRSVKVRIHSNRRGPAHLPFVLHANRLTLWPTHKRSCRAQLSFPAKAKIVQMRAWRGCLPAPNKSWKILDQIM